MALRDTWDSFWRKKHFDDKRIAIGLSQNHSDQRNAQKQYPKLLSKLIDLHIGDNVFQIRVVEMEEAIGLICDCCCGIDVESTREDTNVASSSGCKEVDELKTMTHEVVATDSLNDTVVGDTFNDNSVDNTVLAKLATILILNSSHLERI
ncbi:hypothetical protein V6N12_035732 [Hibiscus sabdariffa]|uniref:Uncharacterized protein n=1 Tax=Hibiscus sabdariffa TaxID=183260 RepID=A0ABR2ENY1_9ROSI